MTFNYRGMYRDYSASEVHLPAFEDVHAIQFTLRQVTELILRHKADRIDTIYGCASDPEADQSQGQEQAEAPRTSPP